MKTFAACVLFVACALAAVAAEIPLPASPADVVVESLPLSLPEDADAAAKVLWESFANKPAAMKFMTITAREWRKLYPQFVATLEQRAAAAKLESEALVRVLKAIDATRGSLAVLPVGAYRATQGSKAIWIVVCEWEIDRPIPNSETYLAHVRIFAYDIETTRQVAFKTCM